MSIKKQIVKIAGRSMLPAIFIFFNYSNLIAQGLNHNWLLGYTSGTDTNVISKRAVLQFDDTNFSLLPDSFNMAFRAAQGNISDDNGNLLMVSNGCWIANSTGGTMLNGSGLNPGLFTSNWCNSISGIPFMHTNIVLPFPGDSNKYVLFHQTGNSSLNNSKATELYYSVIDMTLDNGLGGVISGQKNLIAIQDTLNEMLAACKHANGRDWWIIAFKDSTDILYKILLTPQGIASVTTQSLGMPSPNYYGLGQANFSPDGNKFAYHHRDFGSTGVPVYHQIRLFDFDRCSGLFSNSTIVSLTDSISGLGLGFSSNSKYLYFTLFNKVFQLNTDTANIQASMQTVAINDTFYSPVPPFVTDFWILYLAANGKIYISSGNSVLDLHFINYPDSSGSACDVQQHAIHLPCWSVRGNVYHPNYYLGPVDGSACDTLGLNSHILENNFNFHFSLSPNPSNGEIKIIYLLPQNKNGIFEMFDINGRKVFSLPLPQWSTLQYINLPKLSGGLYNCIISSGNSRAFKKVAVLEE